MDKWYRKSLGQGAQVYERLREIRDIRYHIDPEVTAERFYIVASDLENLDTIVLFPPGNSAIASACGATPCIAPDFQDDRLFWLSVESYPILPAYPSDTDVEEDVNDS
ncbi:hypothetical protein [Pseudomonas abietaniphila]|uniref:hypothetical protein n=1 Tax=Pseudomonas abietaniphila TaxID=89065 RepID=UPI0007820CD4|nr:hypothetical protein [Pseudomonas abietaniphila]